MSPKRSGASDFFWGLGRFIRRCIEIFIYCVAFYLVLNVGIAGVNAIGLRVESPAHISLATNYWRVMFGSFIVIAILVFKYR